MTKRLNSYLIIISRTKDQSQLSTVEPTSYSLIILNQLLEKKLFPSVTEFSRNGGDEADLDDESEYLLQKITSTVIMKDLKL